MNSETKERVILVVCGVVAAAVAIMLASSGNPGQHGNLHRLLCS